jgi:hypothetical protein
MAKSRVTRKVTIKPESGKYLTAGEIMVACAAVPGEMVPTILSSVTGRIKEMSFEVEFAVGGPDGPGTGD